MHFVLVNARHANVAGLVYHHCEKGIIASKREPADQGPDFSIPSCLSRCMLPYRVILNTRKSNFAMCDYTRPRAHSMPLLLAHNNACIH